MENIINEEYRVSSCYTDFTKLYFRAAQQLANPKTQADRD
jgi:hypothetical protein